MVFSSFLHFSFVLTLFLLYLNIYKMQNTSKRTKKKKKKKKKNNNNNNNNNKSKRVNCKLHP